MKRNTTFFYLLSLLFLFNLGCNTQPSVDPETNLYKEDWFSLGQHNEAPQWFKNAKLGIYFHWGVYSVPAYSSEWYARNMHLKDHYVNKYHLENYGSLNEFGYHDFVPLFKAEHFDASEWAKLFKQAGAKFAGPVAEHHDGFSMWASKITPWNVMDKGPKKDIMKELKTAIDNQGMKFITTFHHAKHLQRSKVLGEEDKYSHYPFFADIPPSSNDPELAMLYGNIPPEKWHEDVWLGKLKEVIDNYEPDIIWFDYVLDKIPEKYRKAFAAYYLNQAGDKEVVIIRKQHDLPQSLSIEDLEQSRKKQIGTKTWMTDATISDGSWSYTKNLGVKSATDVLHMLVDIVSKNGILLLNISPKADGSIPENQKEALLSMGNWLSQYGEAIYDTEAWHHFGEGPTAQPEGHFKNKNVFNKLKYTAEDIRYTVKDYNIYAIFLGDPARGEMLLLNSFSKENMMDEVNITGVELLGSDQEVIWNYDQNGLNVSLPSTEEKPMATVLKIKTQG